MLSKKAQAAYDVTILILLMALFMLGYILLLPQKDREELLGPSTSGGTGTTSITKDHTLLSESVGKVGPAKSMLITKSLEPIRLYSTTEALTEPLAASLTVSRNIFQNNYKEVSFDIDNIEDLQSLALTFLIADAKGELTIMLNGNTVYEGEVSSAVLPIELPTSSLKEKGNVLTLRVDSPGWKIFSAHYYLLQDIKLIEEYRRAEKVSTRTFSVEDPGEALTATLNYFITCNQDDNGVLTISLNSREVFSDQIFCEYLTERELSLNPDYLQRTNTLKFEITEGDYNIEELQANIKTKTKTYPSFSFDIDNDLADAAASGEKAVLLKLTFDDDSTEKKGSIVVQDYSFSFKTSDSSYEKDISDYIDDGANTITIKPETTFTIDNVKVYEK